MLEEFTTIQEGGSNQEEGSNQEGGSNLENTSIIEGLSEDTTTESSKRPPVRSLRRAPATRALPGLVLHVFQIQQGGKVVPFEDAYAGLNEALDAENIPDVPESPKYWVDVDADERDRIELHEWIDTLNLGSFISDQIKKPVEEWVSHVVSTRSKTLIIIRILAATSDDGKYVSNRVEYLAAVTTKHMLLTYTTAQKGGGMSLDKQSIRHMTQEECLLDGSTSAGLISWLEFHIFRTRRIITTIRKYSASLVKRLDENPSMVHLDEILQLRNKLLIVLAVAEEQAQCLSMIKKIDEDTDGLDFTYLKGSISTLIATAESTERMCLRLEKRGEGLKQAFDSHQQNRMNRRLAILTVVSAIFMPLTFMAGVYGMNFVNMPELESENGYFVLLATMFTIALIMVAFFQYHGWFD